MSNKIEKLEEMDKFLERYSLLRQRQKKIENINRPVTNTGNETVIKIILENKSSGLYSFTSKFYQTFREELTLILLKLF